jgi:uncharacterized protein (DUF2141 family)
MRCWLALAVCAPLPCLATDVTVTVAGIRNDHGQVLVAVCERESFLQPRCPWMGRAAAHAGDVQVVVPGVPPGTYAAQAFHDEDGNGRLERSFLGLPKEGMGFSRDAPMHFGPPQFDAASFTIGRDAARITFRIRYF